jgi:hypothetical protein
MNFMSKEAPNNCSLCMTSFNLTTERRPLALPCGHNLCRQCLKPPPQNNSTMDMSQLSKKAKPPGKLECPVCRRGQIVTPRQVMQLSVPLQGLIHQKIAQDMKKINENRA